MEEKNKNEEQKEEINDVEIDKTTLEEEFDDKKNKITDDEVKDIYDRAYNEFKTTEKDYRKLFIGLLVITILCLGVVGYILLRDSDSTINKEKVELKYTNTSNTNSKDGTYIIDVSDVVEEVMPSIVSITSKTLVTSGHYGPSYFKEEQYATGAGSGIIIAKTDKELMILTNRHVIEDADNLSVQFINNKSVDATIKGTSSSKDIAVISIPIKNIDDETLKSIKIATLGSSDELKVGEGVIAIGNALGYGQSVTTGVISALNREVTIDNNTTNMIQTDAAINGGNSGGALLNSKGEVIGINSAKYSSNSYTNSASIEGMGFAIPISDISDIVTNLINGDNLSEEERGYLGVEGYIITSEYSEVYNIPTGFYINGIVNGSGAAKANLEIGNIITSIDGKKITSFNDITSVLETKKAKEKVTLKIKYIAGREYKEKEVKLTLSSYQEVN